MVVGIGAAVVFSLALVRPLALNSPTVRATLETCMILFGVASAFLLANQVIHTHRLRGLLVLAAVVVLTPTELLANALPAALSLPAKSGFRAVLPLGQLLGALLLAAAAFTPSDRLVRARRPLVWTVVLLSGAAVGLAELIGLGLRPALVYRADYSGRGIDEVLRLPFGFIVLLAAVLMFMSAAVGFDRRARQERRDAISLLAGAALLFGAARLYVLLTPVTSPMDVTLREPIRLLAFGLLFLSSLRPELYMRLRITRAAASSERRRVAQDLHDGLAQDLAVIAAHQNEIAASLGQDHPVAVAARRALSLARVTIGDLSEGATASVRDGLELLAHDLGARFGIEINIDVQLDGELPAEDRRHVLRIAREAIANAARHGEATHVAVTLKPTSSGLALRVSDDGCGIDHALHRGHEGFGLRDIGERAAALGGSLAVRSGARRGTELEVVFS